jgi:hypothetical protein
MDIETLRLLCVGGLCAMLGMVLGAAFIVHISRNVRLPW